ncbi:Ig domain protein group 2 domain protein [Gemmatirosa kalamazoonensis]|uniref:Ig domain protein group 2 domain protein n=1 Tax=Gemmatirosa kalamazoonensis TaxID=861299 RepID=W0RME7_9BACT|nr:Ig-like domain-containing protein [Gemmatirosa kalamazoonensis]AHG91642.1 Ig domain protein group 2 domain protein [Gemmatirosa kalamazoonensis]
MTRRRLAVGAALALAACSSTASDPIDAASVELSASTLTVVAGADAPLTARVRDAGGRDVGGTVVWTTRDAGIAAVTSSASSTGIVRGVAPGTTQVAANFAGRYAVATVTVTPRPVASVVVQPSTVDLRVGGTAQLRARTLDAAGGELTGRTVTFASNAAAVATVAPDGLVTAVAPGTASITVASEGRTALVAVTVTPIPVASVTVAPSAPSIPLGGTVQLAATTLDSLGRPLAGRAVTWTSSDQAVATVSSGGLATGTGVGTARITATIEGRSASATLTVLPRPVASVTLSLASTTLAEGDTARLAVRLADAQGQPLSGRDVTFASDAPNVARVSATGLVTAVAAGTATLSATSEGVRGTVVVRVTALAVAAVRVSPDTTRLAVGATARLTATPLTAGGAPIAGRTIAWTSGAPGVATVASDGTVTALSGGVAVIFAQTGGVVGQAVVIVQAPTVQRVIVSPGTASTPVGSSVTLVATPVDAAGATITGLPVTWSTSDASVAIVSSSGRVVGLAVGTVTIGAASGGATGTATVTITP